MQYLTVAFTLFSISACGFGVGSFHNKSRSGSRYLGPAGNGMGWFRSEHWEDDSGTYNVHMGYKIGASIASAPGRGTTWGRADELALEFRFGRFGILAGGSHDSAKYDDTAVGFSGLFVGGRMLLTPPAPLMVDLNVSVAQGEACVFRPDADGCALTGDDLAGRAGLGVNLWLFGDAVDVFLRLESRVTVTERAAGLGNERFTSVATISELGFQF